MSDPTSIASLLTQTIVANARSSANAKVEIVTLPQNLQSLENPQNLRGQIVQVENNGNITINTDQGQIITSTDQAIRLENGAPIEIRIDAGNPPLQATLRPAPQETAQPQTQIFLPEINLPQALSLNEITNGAELNLTKLNYSLGITQPFLEQIQSQISPLAPLNISLNELGDINLNSPPKTESFVLSTNTVLSPPTDEESQILSQFGNQINIPFRTVASQILSSPLQDPITNEEQPLPIRISTINIDKIAAPEPSIFPDTPKDFALLNTKIGETSAVLQGVTQNQNFAVLRISAPDGLAGQDYALQVPIEDIPVGSKLSINIVKSEPQSTLPPQILTASYYLTPQSWQVFQEIEQALTQTNPQVALTFNTVLPNAAAPSQMGASILFFVAAIRSGDIQGWLGDKTVDALKRAGKSDVLGRLGQELSGLARMNSDGISGDWKALSLPLAWQNEIHKMALHYRSEDEDHSSTPQVSGKRTRFIMDLDLSQMGKVQLDGIFTGLSESVGRLDLILRTEQSFSTAMKQEMRQAYSKALSETKITGELSFQDHLNSWVRITPDEVKEYKEEV